MKSFIHPIIKGRRVRRNGFTLLEILTATAISLIIITALLGITQMILANFQKIRGNTVMEGDAVVALDMLINDLEALVVTSAPNSQSLQVTPETSGGATGVWLTFLTAAIDKEPDDYQGAVRAVSYRLAFQDAIVQGGPDNRYALYRAVADARDTFDNAIGVADLQGDYWTSATPSPTAIENYLVGDIVRFEVRFAYEELQNPADPPDPNTNPVVVKWTNDTQSVEIGAEGAKINGTLVPGGFLTCEVNLTSLDPQGSKILRTNAITLDQAIQRFGKSYVRNTAIFWEL